MAADAALFQPDPPCLATLVDPPDPQEPAPIVLRPLTPEGLTAWTATQPAAITDWVQSVGFAARAGTRCPVPDADGGLATILVGVGDGRDRWALAGLPRALGSGVYALAVEDPAEGGSPAGPLPATDPEAVALAWALGAWHFGRRSRETSDPAARLVWPAGVDRARVARRVAATALVRTLVTTPAGDLGPAELSAVTLGLASHHAARSSEIVGDALLAENWPAVHAVGRGSARAPRLLDLRWGDPTHPKVTLVGKGVVFDSGGLDLKPASAMKLMKKDMGGAAHALGLAHMVMRAGLPVCLRVLIPAVENMVSGTSVRPLDVLATRKGLTVEVGDTDAEGRLVLADALAEADSERPALLIDLATLTGSARAALGPDVPAVFTRHDALADALMERAAAVDEPVWRLPLHQPYRTHLDSTVADLSSTGSLPFAGAIMAALFLAEFVSPETPWLHVDLFAWNRSSRPGRPEGGEAQALEALFGLIAGTVR